MEGRRETEAHSGDLDTPPHAVSVERDVDAKCLEHVGAPAAARSRPVAVLRHRDTRPRRHQRRRRGDIESTGPIAPRAAGINAPRWHLQRSGMRAHRFDEPGHLLHGLSPGPERDQEAGNLHRGRITGHHLVHHGARLLPTEWRALQQLLDRLRGRHGFGYW